MPRSPFIQLFRKNLIYFITLLVDRGASFLMLPVYTYVLMPDEYGVLATCVALMGIASFVITLGIENGLLRFMQDKRDRITIQSTLFWTMLGLGMVSLLLFLILAPLLSNLFFNTREHTALFRIVGGILLFDAMTRFYQYRVAGLQTARQFMVVGLFRGGMTILLTLFFIFILRMKLKGILLAQLCMSGMVSILFMASIRDRIRPTFDPVWLKRILRFGLPMMGASIFITAIHFSDRFFILKMLGLHEAGIYSVAYKLGMVMNLIIGAFSISAIPYVAGLKEEKHDPKQLSVLFDRSVLCYTGFFLCVSLFLNPVLNIHIAGHSLMTARYLDAVSVVPVILLGYVFYGAYIHLSLGFYDREKTQQLTLITGIALAVNLTLNLILIPPMGIQGAAVSTLITFVTMAFLTGWMVRSVWQVRYRVLRNLMPVLISIGLVWIDRRFSNGNPVISAGIFLVFLCFATCVLMKDNPSARFGFRRKQSKRRMR